MIVWNEIQTAQNTIWLSPAEKSLTQQEFLYLGKFQKKGLHRDQTLLKWNALNVLWWSRHASKKQTWKHTKHTAPVLTCIFAILSDLTLWGIGDCFVTKNEVILLFLLLTPQQYACRGIVKITLSWQSPNSNQIKGMWAYGCSRPRQHSHSLRLGALILDFT